jgi:hypothetical protein
MSPSISHTNSPYNRYSGNRYPGLYTQASAIIFAHRLVVKAASTPASTGDAAHRVITCSGPRWAPRTLRSRSSGGAALVVRRPPPAAGTQGAASSTATGCGQRAHREEQPDPAGVNAALRQPGVRAAVYDRCDCDGDGPHVVEGPLELAAAEAGRHRVVRGRSVQAGLGPGEVGGARSFRTLIPHALPQSAARHKTHVAGRYWRQGGSPSIAPWRWR